MRLHGVVPRMLQGDEMTPVHAVTAETWKRWRRRRGLDRPREEMRMCAYWKCQRMFLPRDPKQRYCNARCKTAAWRSRERGKTLELRDPTLEHEPEDRYRVVAVTGYNASAGAPGYSHQHPGTSYSVVDDAYNGREVATFYADDPALRGLKTVQRERRAQELCNELNADERDWELGRGKYAP